MRLALLTGRSSWESSALSPVQLTFLDRVAPEDWEVVRVGFPFVGEPEPYKNINILSASARNARQVWWSVSSKHYRQYVAERVQLLIDGAGDRLVVITGSCGLQLLNRAWPRLRVPPAMRFDVVALGPACLDPPRMRCVTVQGRKDWWSRQFYKGKVDYYCACGHLDYWASEEVRGFVSGLIQ